MAIVKMKKLTLLAMRSDREKLIRLMQRMQCVEVTELPTDYADFKAKESAEQATQNAALERVRWALHKLARYDTQPKPAFEQYPQVQEEESLRVLNSRKELEEVITRLEEIERRSGDMRATETRIKTARDQYLPWEAFTPSAQDLASSRTVLQMAGHVPTRNLPKLEEALAPLPALTRIVSQTPDTSNLYVAIHNSALEEGRSALETAGFSQENFTPLQGKNVKQYLSSLNDQEAGLGTLRTQLEEESKELAHSIGDLKILHDMLSLEERKHSAILESAETEQTFLLQGWVPEAMSEKLKEGIQKASPSAMVTLEDPKDDEEPTILLKNGPFVTAFEPVVEGFAMPSYRGIDPTAVMSPFYVILFGMMLSDAGYGLMMALALLIFVKVKKIPVRNAKMLYLLIFGGISTIIWGLAFNTVLGFNPLPRFSRFFPLDAVNDPMPVMAVCLAIGAIHLFSGLGVAAYMNIKRGDPVAAISDQFSWFLLLVGLGLMVLPATATIGKYMAIIGFAIVLLMTGRDKKNPIKRLLSGLGALYGITGWVSDLLSYMRLFGMGLATGVIGMVFNILIGMVWSGGIIGKVIAVVLFVVCHLFNLGINALGAYVHSCRLQYIEFFGKFYEDGGKPFRPLDMKTKYVSIQTAPAE